MYDTDIAPVMVGNEICIYFHIGSGVKQSSVLSQFIWIILMGFVLRSAARAMGEHKINLGSKTILDLYRAGGLPILDENDCKINGFWVF